MNEVESEAPGKERKMQHFCCGLNLLKYVEVIGSSRFSSVWSYSCLKTMVLFIPDSAVMKTPNSPAQFLQFSPVILFSVVDAHTHMRIRMYVHTYVTVL